MATADTVRLQQLPKDNLDATTPNRLYDVTGQLLKAHHMPCPAPLLDPADDVLCGGTQ
ncbi:hypothetical protein [Streptomyces canus]|uniref:hypothetical protein n=1 Tax=Streptomyces canus TaxID=58343 RepID=UPI002E26D28F